MSFDNLKANFEIYIQNFKGENEKSEVNNKTENDENINIFDFAEEFKEFIDEGYNFSTSANSLSKKDIDDLEFYNGVLTTKDDREILEQGIQKSASAFPKIEGVIDKSYPHVDESAQKSNEETLVSLLKEISTNETFINKLDKNQDDKLNAEEFKNFINEAQKIDGNDKDLSLKDIITGLDALANDKEISTLPSKEKVTPKETHKTSETEMSIEELKDEGYENLKSKLSEAKDAINGDSSTLKDLHNKVDKVYDVFQEKLQEESPRLAKKHEELRNEIAKKNKEINKKRAKLLQEQTLLNNSENSLDNVKSRTNTYKERLSELQNKYKGEVDSQTKEEIAKHIATLKEKIKTTEAKEQELKEKIQAKKDSIANLKDEIATQKEDKKVYNQQKKELEEKIKSKYPETEKYLDYYNNAVNHYKEEKINLQDKAKSDLTEAQKECNTNKTRYSKEIEKTTLSNCKLREYSAEAGQKLVNNSMQVEREMYGTGKCLSAVKRALRRAYPEFNNLIANTSGYGSAYQFADALSGKDERFSEFAKNFKEVKCSTNDIKDLPAGAIVVYSANYSKRHGHIAIMDGKGNQYSDWKGDQENLSNYYQKNFWNKGSTIRVFVPVS